MTATLILLMGTNPLPNYLAAQLLEWQKLISFYTLETTAIKNRFIETIRRTRPGGSSFTHEEHLIPQPASARSIRQAFQLADVFGVSHLHYSGGTKVMSLHLYRCWLEAGGHASRASYLDNRERALRFDDGREISTARARLDLETLLTLHGVNWRRAPAQSSESSAPTTRDAHAMARWLIPSENARRQRVASLHRRIARFQDEPITSSDIPGLSQPQIPYPSWTLKQGYSWSRFLRGTWLEFWVQECLLATDKIDPQQIRVGLELERQERPFEVDIAFLLDQNLHLVSCTTRRKMEPCKAKLFEIALRARQMGGILARSSLVCFLDGQDESGLLKVAQLQNDVREVWGAPNTPKVFGRADLCHWLGWNDRPPDLSGLIHWLDGRLDRWP